MTIKLITHPYRSLKWHLFGTQIIAKKVIDRAIKVRISRMTQVIRLTVIRFLPHTTNIRHIKERFCRIEIHRICGH